MPRIANLPPTEFPTLEASFPITYNGETNRYTLLQVRGLMEFAASEISFGGGTVEAAIIDLQNEKVDVSTYTNDYNSLASSINLKASITYVDDGLAQKADITYVDSLHDLMLLPEA